MSRPGTGTDGEMTDQPAVNVGDYVVARHENGDEVQGAVLHTDACGFRPICIRLGHEEFWIDTDWSFELAERPQPPLADGIYQKHNSLRFRREGTWYQPPHLSGPAAFIKSDDTFYESDGWQYVGPEVSR